EKTRQRESEQSAAGQEQAWITACKLARILDQVVDLAFPYPRGEFADSRAELRGIVRHCRLSLTELFACTCEHSCELLDPVSSRAFRALYLFAPVLLDTLGDSGLAGAKGSFAVGHVVLLTWQQNERAARPLAGRLRRGGSRIVQNINTTTRVPRKVHASAGSELRQPTRILEAAPLIADQRPARKKVGKDPSGRRRLPSRALARTGERRALRPDGPKKSAAL